MYRPKDWKNPYKQGCPIFSEDFTDPNTGKNAAYEAGADAMLEGLKKEGPVYKGVCGEGPLFTIPSGTGTLVFIPDEGDDPTTTS